MICLIAKKRLINFLNSKPEAIVPLLIWLKEDRLNQYWESGDEPGTIFCQLGASNYNLDLSVKPSLEIAIIKWLGTGEEGEELRRKVREQMGAKHSDEFYDQVIETEVIITSPPPIDLFDEDPDGAEVSFDNSDLPFFYEEKVQQEFEDTFKSEAEYDKAIDRVTELFNAPLGTPAYDELAALIPLVKSYEAQYFHLPELDLPSAVKSRLNDFRIPPEALGDVCTKEELADFLAGRRMLDKKKLQILLNMLAFRFRV